MKNSTKAANVIEGMPRRKENLTASSLSQPNNNAKEIVAPDLDIPGIIAKDWAIPTKKLSKYLWFFILIYLLQEISAKSIIKAINIDANAIDKFDRKNELKNSDKNNFIIIPTPIIGNVPINIDFNNFLDKKKWCLFLEFILFKLKILYLKYQIIEKMLPIWIMADNEDPGSLMLNNEDIIFKWAVLLTGINSVKPWINP